MISGLRSKMVEVRLKTWPQGGVAFFLIWLFSNVNTRSHTNYPIFMKLDQNICSNNSSAEFENGHDSLKNIAPGGGAVVLIWL